MDKKQLIATAIGEASMCWSETPSGVFDSQKANTITEKLHDDLFPVLDSPGPFGLLHLGRGTFGQAIEALKKGNAVSRQGWNGKGMCIFLNKGSHTIPQDQDLPNEIEGIRANLFEKGPHGTVTRLPNLNMKAATGSTVTGWLASQTDILAEDWGLA
jgi:hypothetical protein